MSIRHIRIEDIIYLFLPFTELNFRITHMFGHTSDIQQMSFVDHL